MLVFGGVRKDSSTNWEALNDLWPAGLILPREYVGMQLCRALEPALRITLSRSTIEAATPIRHWVRIFPTVGDFSFSADHSANLLLRFWAGQAPA